MDLEAARAVHHIEEGGAAVPAARREPAGHAICALGLLPVLEARVLRVHALDRNDALELVREGVDPVGAQAFELRATVVHARELYARRGRLQATRVRSW